MKVLLTGANAGTGRPIIASLAEKGIDVRAFIRNADQTEALSQEDMARQLSKVLDRNVKTKAVPFETLEARDRDNGLSDDRINQMLIMNKHYDTHGFIGNPNVLRMILGRRLSTYRNYVTRLASNG